MKGFPFSEANEGFMVAAFFPEGGKVPHGDLPRVNHWRTSYGGASDINLNSTNKYEGGELLNNCLFLIP